jgi:hypothetical protein
MRKDGMVWRFESQSHEARFAIETLPSFCGTTNCNGRHGKLSSPERGMPGPEVRGSSSIERDNEREFRVGGRKNIGEDGSARKGAYYV